MSVWRQLKRGIGVLVRRDAADRDIADEVDHFLAEARGDLLSRGLSPAGARRAARLAFGDGSAVREQVRGYGWENAIDTLLGDVRHAARRLRRSPGFTVVSVLTLALGIGASTAIFSAVNPILFEPLPYPGAGRIVIIADRASDGSPADVTFGSYREVAERSRSFDALAVMRPWQPTLTGVERPERLDGQRVSARYFQVLGVPPALGRDFDPADDRLGGARVAILGDALWRRRFAGDTTIVGRTIRLDDALHTVIGVMPRGFENVLAPAAQLWTLLQYDTSLPSFESREWGHHLRMVGRLRPDADIDPARLELDRIAHAPVSGFARPPWAAMASGLSMRALQDAVTSGVRPALLAVLGAVTLLLLIACLNVTNLLLARGARRHGEFALRAALGAGQGRLIRQLVTESLLLGFLGGAFGLAAARLGTQALTALSPPGLPRVDAIRLDGAAFGVAVAIMTVVGLASGLVPAVHAARRDLRLGLRQVSRRATGGHLETRRALVVAEVALALVLLVSAGLLFRSLERLFAIAPGFDASRVLVMQVQTSGQQFADDLVRHRFFSGALDAVRRVPGVTSAALTSQLPLSGDLDVYGLHFENDNDPASDHGAHRYAVSPGYFETMGIPLRRGRVLDARDVAGAPVAVLINESLANRRLPGADPIGQRLHVGRTDLPWFTIVGVVGDVKQASLADEHPDAVYITPAQWYFADAALWLVVRAAGDPSTLVPAIERAVWSVDANQPIVRTATLVQLLATSEARRRFALTVFQAFAALALILAAVGIHGVLAGSVSERMREIGVRSALGASRANILAHVVRQGMTLTALGIGIGLVGAVAASQALVSLLFGVSRLDPVTYVAVVALLAVVALVACCLPAWRAARIDPAITLRAHGPGSIV